MKNGLTAHMVVNNEEQWVWYAIQSVLPYVQELLVIDTGSTDKTFEIIASINSPKIKFTKYHKVTADELVTLRNQQLKQTHTPWFLIIDGDEVWPKKTMEELISILANEEINGIVVKNILPVGDLFHYQSEKAGKYSILGKVGHYNIRAYRKMKNYAWRGTYPLEAYSDAKGTPIQNKDSQLLLLKNSYWHLTHLYRSSFDTHGKRKFEIGDKKKHGLPEVFFMDRPRSIPSPWVKFSFFQRVKAYFLTPLLSIKRTVAK